VLRWRGRERLKAATKTAADVFCVVVVQEKKRKEKKRKEKKKIVKLCCTRLGDLNMGIATTFCFLVTASGMINAYFSYFISYLYF
jgi:hypothetical protein